MSKRFATAAERPEGTSVVVFCGGRGSGTILRALTRLPHVRLTLLVNAYDDGLSTGRLRGFVPGMLGASDFRKNLSRLLDLSSPAQFAVADLLEYRFPQGIGDDVLDALMDRLALIAAGDDPARAQGGPLPNDLSARLARLNASAAQSFCEHIAAFSAYARAQPAAFSIEDCALGNLLIAGAYLAHGRSFNTAVRRLSRALQCRAEVLNVTTGENRILVGLKQDGEVLENEARVVGEQSASRLRALYLLDTPLDAPTLCALKTLDVDARAEHLARLHRPVGLSAEAALALKQADVIVYGPGTQHSSLLPSYMTSGIAAAITSNPSSRRVFMVNLHDDNDTQGLSALKLVDAALASLGDPDNTSRLVTDVFIPEPRRAECASRAEHRGARLILDVFENTAAPGTHNGTRVAERLQAVIDDRSLDDARDDLDIYVDLHERSLAIDTLLQEFIELPWAARFRHVHLTVNHVEVQPPPWPAHLSLGVSSRTGLFSDIETLLTWLRDGRSRFFASVCGDGEYSLADIDTAVHLLATRRFGVALGARNQSKQQFFGSLRDAYAGKRAGYLAGVAGGFGVSIACGARLGLILSDPLTGFRVYDRLALPPRLQQALLERPPDTPLEVIKRLVDEGVEIAEIPVAYRHHPGFTDMRWRLRRGLVNAMSILR